MAYIIIKVYSFECDKCGALIDVTAVADVQAALASLQKNEHWIAKGRKHFCPKHS